MQPRVTMSTAVVELAGKFRSTRFGSARYNCIFINVLIRTCIPVGDMLQPRVTMSTAVVELAGNSIHI